MSLPLHPLLYVTICERLCESPICPDNISNCRCTYVFRNCISSSSWLDICELQIHLHRCTHCHLDGCKVSLGSSAPPEECGLVRVGRGSCHRPPSQQSGEGVLPFHNLPSVTLLLAARTREPLRLSAVPLSRRFGATSVDSIQGYCSG